MTDDDLSYYLTPMQRRYLEWMPEFLEMRDAAILHNGLEAVLRMEKEYYDRLCKLATYPKTNGAANLHRRERA